MVTWQAYRETWLTCFGLKTARSSDAVLSIRREAGRAYTRPLRLLTRLTAGAPAGHVINYFHSSSSQHLVLRDDYSRLIRAAPQSPAEHVKLRAASGTHASDCLDRPTRTSSGFWLGGSKPRCRLRRRKFRKFDYEMVHSEVYLNKCVVSIAPFSTPACPDCSQKT